MTDKQLAQDRPLQPADGAERGAETGAAAARHADPALHQLFRELRGLAWAMPGHPVPPEADEADFDNMPV